MIREATSTELGDASHSTVPPPPSWDPSASTVILFLLRSIDRASQCALHPTARSCFLRPHLERPEGVAKWWAHEFNATPHTLLLHISEFLLPKDLLGFRDLHDLGLEL